MAVQGPIIIIDDDVDDQQLLKEILAELKIKNQVVCFSACPQAMEYLLTTSDQPFLIFCDVNLPIQNGIEFKREIDENGFLRKKSIPFVFYSTAVSQFSVDEAYTKMTVQGFFQKGNSYQEVRELVKLIIDYWQKCRHPNV